MASNFRIVSHKNEENLHIKLLGHFDGSSAIELYNIILKQYSTAKKIFIHTCGISSIHPFGRTVFHKNIARSKTMLYKLTFTGEQSEQIAPLSSTH